ncbi:MAG: 5'-methylthioadenosine/adenosylhomocysteine nucleosidase [Buchnera aphidicola (Schlechtendalia peitan)]
MKNNIVIGIIGALDQEIKFLKKKIQTYQTITIFNTKFHIGTLNNIKIVLIKSGVGKVSASITCTMLIQLYKPNVIINIGAAGSLDKELKPGDIVLPSSTCYHDVNLTAFGYSLGQMQNFPKLFCTNDYMVTLTEKCMVSSKINYKKNLIISGDSFINQKRFRNTLKRNFPAAIAVDMESTAIAQVCYQFKKPFLIVKSISDHSDNFALRNFEKCINLASQQCSKIIQILLDNLYNLYKF